MPQGKKVLYKEVNGTLHKECCICKQLKSVVSFGPSKPYKDGTERYKSQCRQCENEKKLKEYHEKRFNRKPRSTSVSYNYQLKGYGVTKEWFLKKYESQKGLCSICRSALRNPFDSKADGKQLAVDHCHTNGVVRGILCRSCNVSLGLLKEDIGVLQRAVDYLSGDY